MVLEGNKYQSAAAPYVEENVLVYDKFAEIISWLEESMQPFYASFGLDGVSRMAEQGAPGLRKTANRRDDVVEKTVEKMLKGKALVDALDQLNDADTKANESLINKKYE